MTKKILFCFLLFTLMIGIVFAGGPAFPHPVYGKILSDGVPVKNAELRVKNLNDKVESIVKTDEAGFFLSDLGNTDPNYRDGDVIKVSLVFCENLPQCSKQISVSGGGNEVSFDLVKEKIDVPLPPEAVVMKFVCPDNSVADSKEACPPLVVPIPEPQIVVQEVVKEVVLVRCADGSVVGSEELCPESESNWIAWVIGILAVLLSGAGGFRFLKGKIMHSHKGMTSYHDPNLKHKNPKFQHQLWKDSALGCIKDVKKIQKGIDLSKGD